MGVEIGLGLGVLFELGGLSTEEGPVGPEGIAAAGVVGPSDPEAAAAAAAAAAPSGS